MILVLSVALVASAVAGLFAYGRTVAMSTELAVEGLAGETRLLAFQFQDAFDQLRGDASMILQTPAATGLVRRLGHGGVDPIAGLTTAAWRHRLETSFISVMLERPSYTKIRYIGLADRGRELVRVTREGDKCVRVAAHAMPQHAQEPFFKSALTLSAGEPFFSQVTYNQDPGEGAFPLMAILRMVLPVFHADTLSGLVVIHADYEALLQQTFKAVSPERAAFIINHGGDYMYWRKDHASSSLFMRGYAMDSLPDFIKTVYCANSSEEYFMHDDYMAYSSRLPLSRFGVHTAFTVVLLEKRDGLLKEAYKIRHETARMIVLLVVGTVLLTALIGYRVTRPLRTIRECTARREDLKQLDKGALIEMVMRLMNEAQDTTPLVFDKVSMRDVIETTVLSLQSFITKHNAVVIYTDALPEVPGRASQLSLLMKNLITHSIQCSTAEPVVTIRCSRAHNVWRFSVHNREVASVGNEWDESPLPGGSEIPFDEVSMTQCKEIVSSHQGAMWLTNEPDNGPIFHFTLPLWRQTSLPMEAQKDFAPANFMPVDGEIR